jgi:hypothetical protein
LTPPRWTTPVAVAVVGAEAVVVPLLAIPGTATPGAALAAALLASFVVAIVLSMRRRSGLVCRCFGAGGAPLGRRHLVRNAVLVTACLGAAPVTGATALPSPPALALGGAVAGLVAILIIRFDDILDALDHDGRA